jgi:hypothetical protein
MGNGRDFNRRIIYIYIKKKEKEKRALQYNAYMGQYRKSAYFS